MFSCGWLWLYAGAALMFLELASPGFVLFFFGLSAATVGVLRLAAGEVFGPTPQLIAFSAFSILYLVFLRRWLKGVFSGDTEKSPLRDISGDNIGRIGRVTAPINPPLTGRVVIGDAEWTARALEPIGEGEFVKIVSQENLTVACEKAR